MLANLSAPSWCTKWMLAARYNWAPAFAKNEYDERLYRVRQSIRGFHLGMLPNLYFMRFLRSIDYLLGASKGLQTSLRTAKDQCMHVVRTLVGVHRLKINHVSHDMIFLGNPVTAMHIP
mgnify:CR=1 FL=1